MNVVDFTLEDHGSIMLLHPQSAAVRRHLADNVSDEAQWWGDALVVEPRFAPELVQQLIEEGFSIA